FRGGAASLRDQPRFSLGVKLRTVARTWTLIERVQTTLDKALPDTFDRHASDIKRLCGFIVRASVIDFEQDSGARYFPARVFATAQHLFQLLPFVFTSFDEILFLRHHWFSSCADC